MGIFSFKSKKKQATLNWEPLTQKAQIEQALKNSAKQAVLFFKHSTRCSISKMALNRFEKEWKASANCTLYYLDLIAYREVSNHLADALRVRHQSPQIIVVNNKMLVYTESHNNINAGKILEII